jgi:hypothetical protein
VTFEDIENFVWPIGNWFNHVLLFAVPRADR